MRSRVTQALFTAASWCARRVPLTIAYPLASFAGAVAFYLWPRGRTASVHNFAVIAGSHGPRARHLAQKSFENYGRYLVDFLRLPSLPPADIVNMVDGREEFAALQRGLETGRGIIVACMHFGNWDLGAASAVCRGYQLSVVVETFLNAGLDRAVAGSRASLGMKLIRAEHPGPSLIRALRKGDLVAVLVDRPLADGGVTVPFFGRPVTVPAGPAKLALAARALVMPVAFLREPDKAGRVRILAEEPFLPPNTGDPQADVAETTRLILRAHERFIRAHPDQWYMFRRMWPPQVGNAN